MKPTLPSHDETAGSPAERLLRPFQEFFRLETSGGIILLLCAAAAMVWANSPVAATYLRTFATPLTIGVGGFVLSKPLLLWINDGLMAIFFLVVGLEIKREVLLGELASVRRAALPIAAAVGGMLAPAAIYAAFTTGTEGLRGWGIPMATDIAFSLGVLALLGRRVPPALRVFLAALAIVDDLGAVLVIAIFYGDTLALPALAAAGVILVLLFAANRAGIGALPVYMVLGAALWLAVLKSGIHATVAGVLLAATIPARVQTEGGADSLLHRLEHNLHQWVAFLIMPVFALANAGVALGGGFGVPGASSVGLGVAVGLIVGKPVGIAVASWMAVKAGVAALSEGIRWGHIVGAGALGGIGFTMSLFIAGLAFDGSPLLQMAKLAILGASLAAGVIGTVVLLRTGRSAPG